MGSDQSESPDRQYGGETDGFRSYGQRKCEAQICDRRPHTESVAAGNGGNIKVSPQVAGRRLFTGIHVRWLFTAVGMSLHIGKSGGKIAGVGGVE